MVLFKRFFGIGGVVKRKVLYLRVKLMLRINIFSLQLAKITLSNAGTDLGQ